MIGKECRRGEFMSIRYEEMQTGLLWADGDKDKWLRENGFMVTEPGGKAANNGRSCGAGKKGSLENRAEGRVEEQA